MLGASVIPECQRVRSPVHSASEARRARNELLQRAQDRVASQEASPFMWEVKPELT